MSPRPHAHRLRGGARVVALAILIGATGVTLPSAASAAVPEPVQATSSSSPSEHADASTTAPSNLGTPTTVESPAPLGEVIQDPVTSAGAPVDALAAPAGAPVGATAVDATAAGAPGSITQVSQWLDLDGIHLAWMPPPTGPAPTHYRVEWQTTMMLTWSVLPEEVTTDLSAVATALSPGTGYRFRIFAVNDVGESVPGFTPFLTTSRSKPPLGDVEGASVSGLTVEVSGWMVDLDTLGPVELDIEVDGESIYTALRRTTTRDDVARAFPDADNAQGFTVRLRAPAGAHTVCIRSVNRGEWEREHQYTVLGCADVTVAPQDTRNPVGNFESVTAAGSRVTLSGWALHLEGREDVLLQMTVNGVHGGTVGTVVHRPDVEWAYPHTLRLATGHGFTHSFTAGNGTHQICVTASYNSISPGATNLGCRTVTVGPPPNRLPLANFESLTASGTAVTLSGWAVDPDVVGPIDVHFYVNGGWGGSVSTTGVRSDVARAYPGTGDQHGFSRTFTAGPGTHQICTYAIDTTTRANTPMGCRTVTVAAPVNRLPLANFEALTASGSTVTLTGWALDPDHVGAIDVHFYVNGGWGGSVSTTGIRSDVARAYPGTGDQHGFTRSFTAGPGTHQICTYAIDTATRANTPMGCRAVTVR